MANAGPDHDLGTATPDHEAGAPAHPYDKTGPFYSSDGVIRLLGLRSKHELDDQRQSGAVLGAKSAEGTWVYPSFQFDADHGRVLPRMLPVIATLRGAPPWGAILWLTTAHPELGYTTPLQALHTDSELVGRLARQYVQSVRAQ